MPRLFRFAAALTCGKGPDGYHLLNRESIDLLRKEQLSSVAKDPSFGCCMGPGYGYALGLRTLVDKSQGQKSPIGEFGWDGAAGDLLLYKDDENGNIEKIMPKVKPDTNAAEILAYLDGGEA